MAAKLGFELVKQAMLKLLMKKGDDGIVLTLPKNEIVDYNAKITMDRLIRNGIDPESLTSPDQVLNVLENINNQMMKNARVISADSAEGKTITDKLFGKKGEVVEFPQKRTFKEEIEAMKKSGDIVDVEDVKISEKITDRDMFKNSNLNKRDSVTETISYIKTLEPMDAMKEANSVIGRKGKYKNLTPEESKKILQDTEDHIFERDIPIDPEDMARGGRAGHYTGGMVDVEPNLSDIGHGSDALMARTRLVSPDGQATTSTGLNYLLAEDNDNIRVPFSKGKLADAARRKFMKTAGAAGAGIAALKTGLLGFGKEAAPVVQKAVETVSETAQGVPPYFLNLVNKIRKMGESTLATKDKANAYKFKDYVMEEDFAGNIEIMKKGDDVAEDVYMSYKVDEVPVKKGGSSKVEEYEEYTARPDGEGKMKDIEQGVPDEVVQEGTMFEDNMTEFGMTKKADGGRIGLFMGGGLTAGKGLLKNMLKFMSKDGSHKKSPAEILKMMNPKQYEKLLNNPKYQGQVSSEAPEGLDKIIQDMIGKTKTDRSDMVGDLIGTARRIKKTDDDIIDYKNKIIKDLMDRGSDRETAEQFAETLALQVSKAAGKKSTPEITEQGLLELENIQKNLLTKDRKLQAQGGLTTMLGE